MKSASRWAIVPALLAAGLWWITAAPAPAAAPASGPDPIQHADAARAAELIQSKKVVVLDLRTPEEFANGHIAGATNIDFLANGFDQKLGALDKQTPYLIHCASGRRSTSSLATFKKLQFKSVIHLDGGMKAWQKAGKPVEK